MAFWIRFKKQIVIIPIMLVIGCGIMLPGLSCKSVEETIEPTETIEIEGTISYITIEGGFWGIIGNDGVNYDPINLVAEYAEGYVVKVEAVILKNQENAHQWGTLIQIKTIEVIASPTTAIKC